MASDYSTRMKAHLAEYKRTELGIDADGLWRSNSRPYPHILPETEYRMNILESIREEFWLYFESKSSLLATHTDFHHLNSSQAFAFNLFYPWLADDASAAALLEYLGLPGESVAAWEFEHMPDQNERTSVDVHMTLGSSAKVLVEVKLTEEQFGQSLGSATHRAKLEGTYRERLVGKTKAEAIEEVVFFQNYQLFRNVSHLDLTRGDVLVVVVPRANEYTWAHAEEFLDMLSPAARARVRLVAVEELVDGLELAAGSSPKLASHMRMLRRKYLPVA